MWCSLRCWLRVPTLSVVGVAIHLLGILRWCWPLCPQVYYPVRHHLVQHMVSAMQRLGFTPSVTIEQRRLAVDLSEVVIKWELQRIKDQQVGLLAFAVISLGSLRVCWWSGSKVWCVCVFQPDSDMDPNSSGDGVNSVSSIKRGLSVDSAQEVKRFRAATGAISAVRTCAFLRCTHCPPGTLPIFLGV